MTLCSQIQFMREGRRGVSVAIAIPEPRRDSILSYDGRARIARTLSTTGFHSGVIGFSRSSTAPSLLARSRMAFCVCSLIAMIGRPGHRSRKSRISAMPSSLFMSKSTNLPFPKTADRHQLRESDYTPLMRGSTQLDVSKRTVRQLRSPPPGHTISFGGWQQHRSADTTVSRVR